MIRPYSCLPYAWDEPSGTQALLVKLPGAGQGRALGTFPLDRVRPGTTAKLGNPRGGAWANNSGDTWGKVGA